MFLPMFLCVGSMNCLGEVVTHTESVEAALPLSCGGDCQTVNDEAFNQCTSPSPGFPTYATCAPTLELGDPCEQRAEESFLEGWLLCQAVSGVSCDEASTAGSWLSQSLSRTKFLK